MRGRSRLKPTIFLMKNRKGQFYLIAAIIIITVIIVFVTVSNYSRKKTSVKLYDLGEELGIESQNVIDYGTYTGNDTLRDFLIQYSNYTSGGIDMYVITGNENNVNVYKYSDGVEEPFTDFTENKGKVIITIEEVEYQFDLMVGENFYFVVLQEIDGEKYVVTG